MITISLEKKIAQLEARIARLEGYGLLEKKTVPINYTLDPIATDLDFFRDPDQIKHSLSEFMKAKREKMAKAPMHPEKLHTDIEFLLNPSSKTANTYQRPHKDEEDR